MSSQLTPMDQWAKRTLPPEIWSMTLEYLKGDPVVSFLNLIRTCSTWSDLLNDDKANMLFPMVVPQLEKYLSGNDMLACRRVSPKWRDGVDQFRQSSVQQDSASSSSSWTPNFSNELVNAVTELEQVGSGSYRGRNVVTSFSQMDGFQQEMANNPGNPFPSRSLIYQSFSDQELVRAVVEEAEEVLVEVEVDLVEAAIDFVIEANQRMLTFFATFGLHILDFTYVSRNFLFEIPRYVADSLGGFPNLTTFSLHHEHPSNNPGWPEAETLRDAKLPELRSLKSLYLNAGCLMRHLQEASPCNVAKTFELLLVAYGAQLEQLETDSEVFFATEYFDLVPRKSQKLASLKRLKVRNIGRGAWNFRWLETKLLNLALPHLERVSLHFMKGRRKKKVELRRLFGLLSRWAATLTEVHLLAELSQLQIYSPFYSREYSRKIRRGVERKLSNVRVFGVCYSLLQTPVLSWVLEKFPKLERLELHGYRDSETQSVVLAGEGRKLSRSLEFLWDVVPPLKEIVVWDSVLSENAPKMVVCRKRAERRRE